MKWPSDFIGQAGQAPVESAMPFHLRENLTPVPSPGATGQAPARFFNGGRCQLINL